MKAKKMIFLGATVIPLLSGCAMKPVSLDPVGPAPASSTSGIPTGGLRVFTATETHEIGDDTFYHPRTGYRIYKENGQLWKYIPNHDGDTDESVASVQIPEGNYRITAQSEAYNLVSVPITIRAGETTDVHLGTIWKIPAGTPTNEFVYLPDGYPVGWRSVATK